MISILLNLLNSYNPVNTIEALGKNVDTLNKLWKKNIKTLPLSKVQKQYWETFGNFGFANWLFVENATKNCEALINFRKKIIINIFKEFLKQNFDIEKINRLIKLGLEKDIELIKKDDKSFGQIITDFREQSLEAFFSNDKKAWLNFSRRHLDKQYWAGRGSKKLMDLVRNEYGLDIETEEVLRTPCLRLLRVNPIYNEGEKREDFKYTPQPLMWLPPTVLDHHIISLLPNYGMSLVHHLAKFHPTYVMILNDYSSEAVTNMSMEEFVDQTAILLEFIYNKERTKPIFAGYCQGGTIAVLTSLTERLRPFVKSVFTVAAATGKKEEDSEISSIFLDGLNLVSEVVKNGYMVAPEFLSIGLKKSDWSPYGDLLNNLLKAEKYGQRIKEIIDTKGYDVKKARKVLAYEIIKEIIIEIWLSSMHHVPLATTLMTLPVFRTGILPNGNYDLTLFKQKINVKDYDKYDIPVHIFAGEFDKVVPKEAAIEMKKFVNNCFVHLFPGRHISMCTNFKGGTIQDPIVKTVEKIFKMFN